MLRGPDPAGSRSRRAGPPRWAFAAVLSSLGFLFDIVEEIVGRHVGSIMRDLPKVRNFMAFLDLPERGGEVRTLDSRGGLALVGVRFRYPGAARDALKGVTLEIRGGETVSWARTAPARPRWCVS